MRINSPYRNQGSWLKGSLHIHSSFSKCGWHSMKELALAYRDYDFIAITDHDRLTTETDELKNKIVLKGMEVSGKSHMLCVGLTEDADQYNDSTFSIQHYSELAKLCTQQGGIAIINHPTRSSGQHWKIENIMQMEGITGIEIFSGDGIHIEEDVSMDLWDSVLSSGKRLWGFGNDDFHHWGQERRVWNMVNASNCEEDKILEAYRMGDFYLSTGYGFEKIEVVEDSIVYTLKKSSPNLENAYKYLTLYGKNGQVLKEVTGRFTEVVYQPTGEEEYVRAEVYISGGYGAFSQPIYIER